MFLPTFQQQQGGPMIPGYDPLVMVLSPADREDYIRLAQFFTYADDRNKRNLGMPTFIKHLSMIHNFIFRGDASDCLRGLVCGIQFGVNSLLINTSRLKKLMCRSKSCMNGCFQKLGYISSKPSQDLSTLLCKLTPGFRSDALNPRNWCVRRAGEHCTPFVPNVAIDMSQHISLQHSYESSQGQSVSQSSSSEEEAPHVGFSFDIMDLLNHHPQPLKLPQLVITN